MNSNYVEHSERMSLAKYAPEAQKAMAGFDSAALTGIDTTVAELVRVRVSQINGCYFCVDMHTKSALKAGEDAERLLALATWREAPLFTARERAALELAERSTLLGAGEVVSDDVWAAAAEEFDPTELAHLVMVIAAINAWNRLAVPSRKQPKR